MTPGKSASRNLNLRRWRIAAAVVTCAAIATLGVKFAASQGVESGNRSPKIVATTGELSAALSSARPGDVIRLKEGVYKAVALSRVHFSRAVRVTSADPAHPAVISGLSLADSSGLIFSQLKLSTADSTDPVYGFPIKNCDKITFDDVIAYGVQDAPPERNRAGFHLSRSSNITISNSRIVHMGVGVDANDDENIIVKRNLFAEMAKSGVGMGAVSFVSLTDNVFTNFIVGRGIHPDGIQIFTATMPTPSHDISVVGNLIYRGRGNAIQGIFIQDEGLDSPFDNVTVADNAVLGGMWDSIYIKHATGLLVVKNNIAASWPGVDMEGSGDAAALNTKAATVGFSAYLWLRGDMSGATISMAGNKAQAYLGNAGRITPPKGNEAIEDVDDEGKGLLKTWVAGHPQLLPLLKAANLP